MEPQILTYQEVIYKYDDKITDLQNDDLVEIVVTPIIKVLLDSDLLGLQFTIQYTLNKKNLLTFGFRVVMNIPGWVPLTSSDTIDRTSPETISDSIKEIIFSRASDKFYAVCKSVLDLARGAMYAKLKDTDKTRIRFPEIPMNEFISIVNFI